jgi:hypothetical protein
MSLEAGLIRPADYTQKLSDQKRPSGYPFPTSGGDAETPDLTGFCWLESVAGPLPRAAPVGKTEPGFVFRPGGRAFGAGWSGSNLRRNSGSETGVGGGRRGWRGRARDAAGGSRAARRDAAQGAGGERVDGWWGAVWRSAAEPSCGVFGRAVEVGGPRTVRLGGGGPGGWEARVGARPWFT